jgi:hypothetical protein
MNAKQLSRGHLRHNMLALCIRAAILSWWQ